MARLYSNAIVREIPSSFANALSATPPDPPIDVPLARAQHAAYIRALEAGGLAVTVLPTDEACPDCVFVEDTAVVLGGGALITRPGAPSRRAETQAIAAALDAFVDVLHMTEPGTLDGGDVMHVASSVFVGRSARTNAEGIAQLCAAVNPWGLDVVPVDLPPGVLHLKCVVTRLGGNRILLAMDTIPAETFRNVDVAWVPPDEAYAANCVAIDDHVILADGFPKTERELVRLGYTVHAVPYSEVRKADGSLTCQSILF
ncbi:MAG: dimethylarginine dimethylaminohydrolase family protein [Kofleriaceae bacterium]